MDFYQIKERDTHIQNFKVYFHAKTKLQFTSKDNGKKDGESLSYFHMMKQYSHLK